MAPHRNRLCRSGLLASLCGLGLAAPAAAGTLTVVHNFTGGTDGSTPYKSPTIDSAGNLYGETLWGANACPDSYEYTGIGCGTTYKISHAGVASTLVTFLGAANGAAGFGNVTEADGYVIADTYQGGADNLGTIFAVKTTGAGYTLLHSFTGPEGATPNSFVRVGANKILYSVASTGGPGYTGTVGSGSGVLFALALNGTYTPEHDFSGGADGGAPGRILLSASGTIYGATSVGGACTGAGLPANGCGVIYSFVPSTGAFAVLYTFTGGADGYSPALGGLDSAGNLYGAAAYGGASADGVLFELKKTGTAYSLAVLHSFTGGSDGANPLGPPSFSNGTLYGTAFYGGTPTTGSGAGTLYSYKAGTFSVLYSFNNGADGGYPEGTPFLTSTGAIVGTAAFGGANQTCTTASGSLISTYGCGVVYEYMP